MKTIEAKAVVLGAQGVGKTSITVRYVDKQFSNRATPTIGASFFNCKIVTDDCRVKLQIWDTAGQERFKAMAPMFYRKSNAAILVYDITNAETFKEVRYWAEELRRNIEDKVIVCVIGNKNDLNHLRQVNYDDANDFARSIGADYMETSALCNTGIQEAFTLLANGLVKRSSEVSEAAAAALDRSVASDDSAIQVRNTSSDIVLSSGSGFHHVMCC